MYMCPPKNKSNWRFATEAHQMRLPRGERVDKRAKFLSLLPSAEVAVFTFTTALPFVARMGRGILLTSNLPQLQNLIKRDPTAYKEEFLQQWNHYKSILSIFQANPVEQSEQFRDMITFISQVF